MADHANAGGIDLVAIGDEAKRILRVCNLIEAPYMATRSLALTTSSEVNAKRAIAEVFEHTCLQLSVRFILRADESMQYNKAWQPLAIASELWHVQHPGQFKPVGGECESLLHLI